MNTLNKCLLGAATLLMAFGGYAQEGDNLVRNPGFENANARKVRRIGAIDQASGWHSPTKEDADLFIKGAKNMDLQTPKNIYGVEDPHGGGNYAGIKAYSFRNKLDRSYITTELKKPLVKGVHYRVRFYAALADLSSYASNRLGVHFSRRSPDVTTKKVSALILHTDVEHPKKKVFNARFGWDIVCGEYVATGREKYLTIGVFVNNNDVDSKRMRKSRDIRGRQIIAAYYYIDDVSVEALGDGQKCQCGYSFEKDKKQSYTLFQRAAHLNDTMSLASKVKEYQVYYTYGRYDIKGNNRATLAAIVKFLTDNPNLRMKITGHSDNHEAKDEKAKGVSLKRADYVKKYLEMKGIDGHRLFTADAKNTIKSNYIHKDDDPELQAAKNRRVTFSVVQ